MYPKFQEYSDAVILGSTGLSHFQIWKDLISFHKDYNLNFKQIFLLGGDRLTHPYYDSLDIAYKHYPKDFIRWPLNEEITSYKNEMEVIQLITFVIRLPKQFYDIPITSIFTQGHKDSDGHKIQADTEDTIIKLNTTYNIPKDLPILFISTLPYSVRQGIQIKSLMQGLQNRYDCT